MHRLWSYTLAFALQRSSSFSRWASHDIFLFKYNLVLHILRFLFFFSDSITADVASKQQTTALFLSTIVTCKRRHKELTKNWQTWWETCAVPENIQFGFSCSFFYTVRLHRLYINKSPTWCKLCSLIYFTAKSLYMFRVTQHPSSGVLKTVTAASGTGHNIGTATSFQRGEVGTGPETCRVILQ